MSWNIGLKDKIGTLSHSAGVISLQPSLLTIGGRQYKTTAVLARTISADVTMTANSLYMIYAQVVSGVVVLRISASVRSSYKLINTQSELVGAFYASGVAVVDFGSFVNIYGSITTDQIPYAPTILGATTNPGFGTGASLTGFWERDAGCVIVQGRIAAGTGTSTGSGIYYFTLPTSIVIYISKVASPQQAAGLVSPLGSSTTASTGGTSPVNFTLSAINSSGLVMAAADATVVSATFTPVADGKRYTWTSLRIPVVGWSANTQLMDL